MDEEQRLNELQVIEHQEYINQCKQEEWEAELEQCKLQSRYWQALEQLVVDYPLACELDSVAFEMNSNGTPLIDWANSLREIFIKRAKEMVDGDVLAHHSEDKLDMVELENLESRVAAIESYISKLEGGCKAALEGK